MQHPVFLVGAGPGDPDLLTVKALRLLEEADTVVYDRLVSEEILALIPAGVSRVYVGKSRDHHAMVQEEINELLIRLAKSGRKIVRLKGGDPFIFGRGGEEALALRAQGLNFEIVPGITAAQACAAYAGIPLTHRGVAQGVSLITGHLKDNQTYELASSGVTDKHQTLVIYMGLANSEIVVGKIIAAGRDPRTPVAIVERGTSARQRVLQTTLSEVSETVAAKGIQPPSMIIIGEVTLMANQLAWFCSEQDEQISVQTKIQMANG